MPISRCDPGSPVLRHVRPSGRRHTAPGTGDRRRSHTRGRRSPDPAVRPVTGRPRPRRAECRQFSLVRYGVRAVQQQYTGDRPGEHDDAHDRQHKVLPTLHRRLPLSFGRGPLDPHHRDVVTDPADGLRASLDVVDQRTDELRAGRAAYDRASSSRPFSPRRSRAAPGTALEQAVGQQHQPVPGRQLQDVQRPLVAVEAQRWSDRGLHPLHRIRARAAACRDGRPRPR